MLLSGDMLLNISQATVRTQKTLDDTCCSLLCFHSRQRCQSMYLILPTHICISAIFAWLVDEYLVWNRHFPSDWLCV